MNIKQKSENKNRANEFRYFLEANFVGFNRSFVLLYPNRSYEVKRFKTWRYYLPKSIRKKLWFYHQSENFYNQPNDSGVERYEEIRKLTTGEGKYWMFIR